MFDKGEKKYSFLKIIVAIIVVALVALSFFEPTARVQHIEKTVDLTNAQ